MTSAIADWKQRVEGHNLQSTRVQGESLWASGEFWRPLMSNFKVDPRRTDDPALKHLLSEVGPDATVTDVGGGAGRFALPLALRCKHVVVVEPADSMVEALNDGAREAGIGNVTVVQELWENADVERADIVLSAHSVYGVVEAGPFIRKLEASARQKVIVVALTEQPQSQLSPFWNPIYGEERIDLPALRELMNVLWELEIFPSLQMFPPTPVQTFESKDAAFEQLRHRLHLDGDSDAEGRLRSAISDLLVQTPHGLTIKGSKPRRLGVLTWTP